MEKNEMKIERVLIREPYRKDQPMVCEITVKGRYGNMELSIDPELIQPIVHVVAGAIAEAGRRTAVSFAELADAYKPSASVIEHVGKPLEIAEAQRAEDA